MVTTYDSRADFSTDLDTARDLARQLRVDSIRATTAAGSGQRYARSSSSTIRHGFTRRLTRRSTTVDDVMEDLERRELQIAAQMPPGSVLAVLYDQHAQKGRLRGAAARLNRPPMPA